LVLVLRHSFENRFKQQQQQQQQQQPNLAGGSTLKGSKEHASDRHPQRKMFILVFFRGVGVRNQLQTIGFRDPFRGQ